MDLSSVWAPGQLHNAYQQAPAQYHDAYQQAPAQYHDAYLHAPPAQHHDIYRHLPAVRQYDSYQNAAIHYQSSSHDHGATPSQQHPSYDHSHYHNPLPSRYASSQSHYQAVGTEAEMRYLRGAYDGVPGATGVDVGSNLSVAGAQRLHLKGALRQFIADPNTYAGSALHALPNSSMVVNPSTLHPMGTAGTNLLGPRRIKNMMKKKAKGWNYVKSQPAYCQVCKVECNTEEMLKNHKAGKKHKNKLEALKESISMTPSKPPGGTAPQPSKAGPVTAKLVTQGTAKSKKKTGSENEDLETKKPKVIEAGAPAEGTAKSKKKTGSENEDLETKKRKVLEAGAPAEGVKICTLCNVVCNSPLVFNCHLEGQRHKTMVLKLQEGQQVAK